MIIKVNNQDLRTPDEIDCFVHFTVCQLDHIPRARRYTLLTVYSLDEAITLSRLLYTCDQGKNISEIECSHTYIKLYLRSFPQIPKHTITVYPL